MATSTLVQFLGSPYTFDPVTGAIASTTTTEAAVMNRRQVETFLGVFENTGGAPATVTLNAGTWVAFDAAATGSGTSGPEKLLFVKPAAVVAAGNGLAVGVLLDSVTVENVPAQVGLVPGKAVAPVNVVIAGYVKTAAVATGTAAGTTLTAAPAAIGRAAAYVAGTSIPACGVCLELAAANVAPVWVFKQF